MLPRNRATTTPPPLREENEDGGLESLNGGGKIWRNKSGWLANAPAFNVDRMEAALLFTTHAKELNYLQIEMIGALRANHKPFQYLLFPLGDHQLQRPRERLASLTASVDWMSFWLQGYERKEPIQENAETKQSLAEKYRRGDKLCDVQVAASPGRTVFCVSSTRAAGE
jgi:hypothetical protein